MHQHPTCCFTKKGHFCDKCVRKCLAVAEHQKSLMLTIFEHLMSTHRSGMRGAVTEPPHMSVIHPNMLTNRHMFGLHRPTHARVTLTALRGIMKREKRSRRWPRNVANLKKMSCHMLFLKGVFENQKVDMRSQLSGLLPPNMCEQLPIDGPPSIGALYSPV